MNLAEFHFIRPWWLLAIIPAIVILVLFLKNKLNQGNWSTVCDAELLPFVLQEKPVQQHRWMLFTGALSCLLVIIALAGPSWERLPSPVFRNDAALVIALDLSLSMNASDIKPSRIKQARYKIADILKQRKDGQTALLVYAGDAFIVTPLTEDIETIANQLTVLTPEIMPVQGSDTVLAINKAVELLKQSGLQKGDILLITDGVDFDSAIKTVKSMSNYRLSILGIGTVKGAPIKKARGGFVKDEQGNIVVPKLHNKELSRLASKGKGIYQKISSDDSDIENLLAYFDNSVEKQGNTGNNLFIDQWSEMGPWLLLLVLPLVALNFRKGVILALICFLPFPENSYALEWNDLWQSPDQQGQEYFKQEKYLQAAEKFEDPKWKAVAQYKARQAELAAKTLENEESASDLYNKGNALAQSGKFEESIEAYKESLKLDPENEDAKYNKKLVEKELEKQKQQQNKDKKESEQDKSEEEKPDQDKSAQKEEDQENDQKDSSEQSEDQDNAEKDDKAEQSGPEQSEQDQEEHEQSEEQQSEAKSAEQLKDNPAEDQQNEEAEAKQIAEPSEYDESEQAKKQWLKRIPDDPAGLLKRKFKYQYGRRRLPKNQ